MHNEQRLLILGNRFLKNKKRIIDIVIILFFALLGVLFFIGRWGGLHPALLLFGKDNDTGALLMYSAALDHPENFVLDQFLNPAEHLYFYTGIYLPFIRFFGGIFKDYALGFLILLPFCVTLQLTSFYILGKVLFNNRFWALLLSFVTSIPIYITFWDLWGFYYDPLPRFLFGALAPFFLYFAIKWRIKTQFWPFLMIACSVLFFIHAISAPALAVMIWCGFILDLPKPWKTLKKIGYMLLTGLCFLIPYGLFAFVSRVPFGPSFSAQGVTYTQIMAYFNRMFVDFLNLKFTFVALLYYLLFYNILLPAVFCIVGIFLSKFQERLKTNLVLVWIAACFIFSLVIPGIEHEIEKALKIPPIQLDLARDIRYIIPLLMIVVLSGFVALTYRFKLIFQGKRTAQILVAFTTVIGIFWVFAVDLVYFQSGPFVPNLIPNTVLCISKGKLFCPDQSSVDEADMLDFIRESTPIDSRFISVPKDYLAAEIRYGGLRSVAYTGLDINRIVYGNFAKAMEVDNLGKEWRMINEFSLEIRLPLFERFSCQVGATHWVIDSNEEFPVSRILPEFKLLYENSTYKVFELPPCVK